jgi:WD40 repeat protein
VHRDVKPENIMLTRAGRVVVMDFGLARQEAEGSGSASGTPAYMAPEQAAGLKVDARADVYSAGVVLAEMVHPEGIKNLESRKSVWEGIRQEPARVPESPWKPVLKRAVARDPDQRYRSAHTLTRALEDVTLRVEGAEDLTPYPGLAAFTEEDAEYFFGREAEVERLWRRLDRPHLLAIVGPSGSGKTSFIRAGLIPSAASGWSIVRCTPGYAALASLRRALAPEISDDPVAVGELAVGDADATVAAYSRWRARHGQALLVVDQFEELFTLNPAGEQEQFAELLGRLALEADVFVLLSLRDDFLMQCRDHEPLQPIFSDLTALTTLAGSALRRALVHPANTCGYRFEDDELVEEMLVEVEGERGALPLLAFAVSRLWEKRDRDNGLLTRESYHDIGGVAGALARHAEATIERIGADRIPIVRELFRNLMTAQSTRVARETDELLSVFRDDRDDAAEVLHALIDVRLLTSYELPSDDGPGRQRVEVIHESLVSNWPRLVGWRTQDADGARLRDRLRSAASAWDERGRPEDLLWSGTTYREFLVWRERYPGGLTRLEEEFARSMTSHATRRKRRRRIAATAAMLLSAVVAVVTTTLWRRSDLEARRAEAANLVSLGQLELESYPSSTVAHAIASLELADSWGARRLALEALWKGPTALVVNEGAVWSCGFGPEGRSLVQAEYLHAGRAQGHLSVVRSDGTSGFLESPHCETTHLRLSKIADTGHFTSGGTCEDRTYQHVLWSMLEGRPLADIRYRIPAPPAWSPVLGRAWDANRERLVLLALENERVVVDILGFDGSMERLCTLGFDYSAVLEFDRQNGRWLAVVFEDEAQVLEIRDEALSEPRPLGRLAGAVTQSASHDHWLAVVVEDDLLVFDIGDEKPSEPLRLGRVGGRVASMVIDPDGEFVVTAEADGKIRLWSLTEVVPPTILQGPPRPPLWIGTDGSLLELWVEEEERWICWLWNVSGGTPRFLRRVDVGEAGWGGTEWDKDQRQLARWGPDKSVRVWAIGAPADAEPLVLLRGENEQANGVSFGPRGHWLATADFSGLAMWPLAREYPAVIRRHNVEVSGVAFAPDGRWLVSSSEDGSVWLWPLAGDTPAPGRALLDIDSGAVSAAASPDGERILVGTVGEGTWLLRPGGGAPSNLEGIIESWGVAFSADGRLAAAVGGVFGPEERMVRVWDLESGAEVSTLMVGETTRGTLQFTPQGQLLSTTESGLQRWDAWSGERELLYEGIVFDFVASADGGTVLMVESEAPSEDWGQAVLLELDSGKVTPLDRFGHDVKTLAIDSLGGLVVTGDRDGEVRVGRTTGEEPHLLLGHEGTIQAVAIDPGGRWVASGGDDTTVRLWPMPDLSKPPLHTLSHDELIAKLKTLTNLRAVRDETSATGWTIEIGPFPGWKTIPEW